MKKLLALSLVLSLALVAALPLAAQDSGSTVRYEGLGFSMKPLEAKKDASLGVVFYSMLPVSDNFAPNVNVIIQSYDGTLEDYKAISDQQIEEMGLRVLKSELRGDEEFFMEYSGEQNGLELHFIVRVLRDGDRLFLVTGTALEKQWRGTNKALRETLDSFALND